MDTTNTVVKKQVIELLSALCVYSNDGYERALSALEHFKVSELSIYELTYAVGPALHVGWMVVWHYRNYEMHTSNNVYYRRGFQVWKINIEESTP